MKLRYTSLILVAVAFVAAAILATYYSDPNPVANLPHPQVYQETEPVPQPINPNPTPNNTLPSEMNLAIPFTSQAPHKNWEDPYGDFCEEASVLMASHYLLNKNIPNPEYADAELLKIKTWEEQVFGYHKDTTAEETAKILRDYFGIKKVELLEDPSIEQIKRAVADGRAVIMPAAGRQLPNPNFRSPGPLYHMLVIKGYTNDGKIITNDPGTRLGADFLYEASALMNAVHDWNNGDVETGRKVVIIVG